MEAVSKALLSIHVFAGFTSIVLFWIPIFVKKGGNIHVKIGKAYVFLMWIVVLTAAILSVKNFIIEAYSIAAFLGFLAVITANPLWYGIAILKHKKGLSDSYKKKHMTFNAIIFVFGIILFSYGVYLKGQNQGVLMLIFGVLGMTTGADVVTMYRNPQAKSNWIIEHIGAMMTTGIAAYTAFAVFGGQQFFRGLLTGYWAVIPWVLPTVVGVIIIRYYKASFMKKQST